MEEGPGIEASSAPCGGGGGAGEETPGLAASEEVTALPCVGGGDSGAESLPLDSGTLPIDSPGLRVPVGRGGLQPVLKGQQGVQRMLAEVRAAGGEVLATEITIDTPSGARIRADALVKLEEEVFFVEVKNGPSARLSRNQEIGYPSVRESGGVIRRRGIEDYPYGSEIKATPVREVNYR